MIHYVEKAVQQINAPQPERTIDSGAEGGVGGPPYINNW